MSLHSEQVLASKLRKTEALRDGRVRQFFDVLPCPGMQVICESVADNSGEFEPISQVYRLANGAVYDDADAAFLAWANLRGENELLDAIGEALLRHHHGLIRPLWQHRTPEQKSIWLTRARHFLGTAQSIGLNIERKPKQ